MEMVVLVIVVLFIAGAVLWWVLQRGTEAPATVKREDRLDTVAGWPPAAARILTTAARVAYTTLCNAMPGYMVLAQVPVARFTRVPMRNSYAEWLRRIGTQCADLVVCDMATHVIGVVQEQPAAGESGERARRRLARMQRVLKAEGIPGFVWVEGAFPDAATARAALLPAAAGSRSGSAADAPPVGAIADDAGRDGPPSTWYDDLDTGHATLDADGKPSAPR